MKSIIILIACLSVSAFVLTWIMMNFSLKRRILDMPNERSSHSIPTPRGGGLATVIVWYSGISIIFFMGMISRSLYLALLSGIFLAGISLIDDLIGLKPYIRLIGQTFTVVIAFLLIHGVQPVIIYDINILPQIILLPITIVGIVWFINLYNFLDGIDGYASIEAIAIATAFFLFTRQNINLVLAASVFGFLIWNWPRAKIFMGDVGSTQLGFIIAILGVYFHNTSQLSLPDWLILLSPFWFDATLTLFRRWKNNEKLSQAHRKHVYQRLVQSGFSHLEVDIFLAILNSVLFLLVLLSRKWTILYLPILLVTLSSLYLITRYTDRRKPF
jgi:UDP-N-acetylmuramyl pentapeptide phosphotransferase/UDP-N-acetylglucosamine-1-phosphate transferase